MTTKQDKKGPELFLINESMLQGLENLAQISKKQRDNETYEFLTMVKTGLAKIVSITPLMNELAARERTAGNEKIKLADFIEQLFPEVKCQEKSAKEEK
jgi:hypothetical protein